MTNHYNTLLLNIIYNNMKTNKFFLLCIIFALMISENIFAGDATISGYIIRKVTTTSTSASIPMRDCDGNTTGTIPGVTNSFDTYPAYTAFTTVTIKIFIKDTAGSPIQTFGPFNKAAIAFNSTTGAFSYAATGINANRFSYIAKVCLDADVNSSYADEFTISTSGAIFPIGSVMSYMGNSTTLTDLESSGWYKCDGRAISTLTASLSGDEITAFVNVVGSNLPNLRGVFLRGLDEGRGFDEDAGTRTGGEGTTGVRSYQPHQVQAHTHTGTTTSDGNHNHGGVTGNAGYASSSFTRGPGDGAIADAIGSHHHSISTDGYHSHSLTINNNSGAETRPENIAVYYIIRGR